MKKRFVPYNLALKLKKLGFNEDCFGYYGDPLIGEQERFSLRIDWMPESYPFKNSLHCLAPIWEQAFDWFREKHGLHSYLRWNSQEPSYQWEWCIEGDIFGGETESRLNWSYDEAKLSLLIRLITLVELTLQKIK